MEQVITEWWISLDYATFGIQTTNGVVTDTPPIARWAMGRPESSVLNYFRRKGASIQSL